MTNELCKREENHSNKFLDAFVWEGLGNRLRSLASAFCIAQKFGYTLRMDWPVDQACGATWEDLFELKIPSAPRGPLGHGAHRHSYWRSFYLKISLHVLIRREQSLSVFSVFPYRTILISNSAHLRDLSFFYRSLSPVPAVASKVSEFLASNDNFNNIIGVHIRRRDWVYYGGGTKHHLAPRSAYLKILTKYLARNPTKKIFVATDDDSERSWLACEFPGKVLAARQSPVDRSSASSMQDAVVDWLLLSKCQMIFAPSYSSFSREAAKVGPVPFVTIRSWPNTIRLALSNHCIIPLKKAKIWIDSKVRNTAS